MDVSVRDTSALRKQTKGTYGRFSNWLEVEYLTSQGKEPFMHLYLKNALEKKI